MPKEIWEIEIHILTLGLMVTLLTLFRSKIAWKQLWSLINQFRPEGNFSSLLNLKWPSQLKSCRQGKKKKICFHIYISTEDFSKPLYPISVVKSHGVKNHFLLCSGARIPSVGVISFAPTEISWTRVIKNNRFWQIWATNKVFMLQEDAKRCRTWPTQLKLNFELHILQKQSV